MTGSRLRCGLLLHVGLLLLPLGMGCANVDRHEMALGLRTDFVAGHEFDKVEVLLVALDSNRGGRIELIVDTEPFVPPQRLAELKGLQAGTYQVEVRLRDSSRHRVVAKRPALVELENNAAVTVPVTRSCKNVRCPPVDDPATVQDESEQTACLGGFCVDPRCTIETPEFCGDKSVCDEAQNTETGNAQCSVAAACGTGTCALGTCWATAEQNAPAACNLETEWCHPTAGCTAIGTLPAETTEERCLDGRQNGAETGIDCGGPDCAPCPDVLSPVLAEHCRNGIEDSGEQGVDCGGECTECPTDFDCTEQTAIPVHECLALAALARATGGSGPRFNGTWFDDANLCDWSGIACEGQHVTGLEFFDLLFVGTIPPEIANFTELRRLELTTPSRFYGTIPEELAELSNLEELWADENDLTGTIPSGFAKLTRLRYLNLANNNLTGSIPDIFPGLPALEQIILNQNRLSGTIPESIASSTVLEDLDLSNNLLTGTLPSSVVDASSLSTLDLSNNDLTGSIPAQSWSAPLSSVDLSGNALAGPVPENLRSLPASVTLRLNRNRCLYVEGCTPLASWLNSKDPEWSTPDVLAPGCNMPPGACQ